MSLFVMVYKANAPASSLDIEADRVRKELNVSKNPTPRVFLIEYEGSLEVIRATFPNWAIGPNQTYTLA